MEVKLNSKLLQAANGLMLFAIDIILMACEISKLTDDFHWLPALFLLFGAAALCGVWFMDQKNLKPATIACFYVLFAIVMFANKTVMVQPIVFAVWAMIEGGLVVANGLKLKEENFELWFVPACLGALAVLLGLIACFVMNENFYAKMLFGGAKMILVGLSFLFVALAQIAPFCLDFLPKKK